MLLTFILAKLEITKTYLFLLPLLTLNINSFLHKNNPS